MELSREQLVALMAAIMWDKHHQTDAEAVVLAEDLLLRVENRHARPDNRVPHGPRREVVLTTPPPCGNDPHAGTICNSTAAEGGYMAGPGQHPMGQMDPHACRGRDQPYNPMDIALKGEK